MPGIDLALGSALLKQRGTTCRIGNPITLRGHPAAAVASKAGTTDANSYGVLQSEISMRI